MAYVQQDTIEITVSKLLKSATVDEDSLPPIFGPEEIAAIEQIIAEIINDPKAMIEIHSRNNV